MKENTFDFVRGRCPVLISMPHNGVEIPLEIQSKMTGSAKLMADTDWYLDRLYQFAVERGCYLINPKYSRYVIDLNRPEDDQNLYPGQDTTELCPTTQFDKQPIYLQNCNPNNEEIDTRIKKYWRPYHQQLSATISEIKNKFGMVLLFEAHSIKSQVPRFFDGQLPDFNFGDFNHKSCSIRLTDRLSEWTIENYSKVVNGRFKGGYITRAYGDPANNIHGIQLELSQATYMNEDSLQFAPEKAEQVSKTLHAMFDIFFDFINKHKQV